MSLLKQQIEDERVPVGAHLGLIIAFNSALAALVIGADRKGRLREHPSPADIALIGVASYKVSRLIAFERVTTPIRAPFVEDAECEKPTGRGLQRAVGELVTCPFCLTPWIALALGAGLAYRPRATRFVSAIFASMVVADVLQRAYSIVESEQKQAKKEVEIVEREVERRSVGAAAPSRMHP